MIKRKAHNLIIHIVILIVILVLAYGAIKALKKGDTKVYFNAETDIPDETLYLKQDNTTNPVNILEIGKEYGVLFTIECNEKHKTDYNVIIKSGIYNDNIDVSLNPGDKKIISLKINPVDKLKWRLNNSEETSVSNVLDITKESWLADKKDFQVIIEKSGLPTITRSDYNLPISTNLSYFGEIYHMDITFDDLTARPFEKEYVTESIMDNKKEVSTDVIKLFVKGSKLHVEGEKTVEQFISEEEIFLIKVQKTNSGQEVNEESGFKETDKLSFWYKVR